LTNLYLIGALGGASPAEAFQVRCDRSTMTQNDIDNGRVIARVEFVAASPIERITVVLAMDEGGQVSLLSARAAQEVV
jgi:phage tail sheath protein FI